MVSYWDCGVQGFFDATARPNMETPGVFGLEFVVAKDPERLRQTALSTCTIDEEERDKRTWLDYDDDDALVDDDDDDDAKEETAKPWRRQSQTRKSGADRVAARPELDTRDVQRDDAEPVEWVLSRKQN